MSYIKDYDANSLYPTAMCQALPVGGYRKIEVDLPSLLQKLEGWSNSSRVGYLCEVDYHVPPELHDKWDLAPVRKMEVEHDLLCPDQPKRRKTSTKLVPWLGAHTKVAHHPSYLKVLLSHGAVITQVHPCTPCGGSRAAPS